MGCPHAWLVLLTFAWGALGGTVFSCIINSTMGAIAHAIGGTGFGTGERRQYEQSYRGSNRSRRCADQASGSHAWTYI